MALAPALLALALAAGPAPLGLDPAKSIARYTHDHWTDQLPQISVNALTIASNGYLWFGTEEGLVRSDGASFKVFDRSNTPGLRAANILAIAKGRDGSLWVGTRPACVHHVTRDGDEVRAYPLPPELATDQVNAIAEDATGAIWLATSGGLMRLDPANGHVERIGLGPGSPQAYLRAVLATRAGPIMVGSARGLFRVDNPWSPELRSDPKLEGQRVLSLAEDSNGALYVGLGTGGVLRLDRDGSWTELFRETHRVYSLLFDSSESLWAGLDDGRILRWNSGHLDSYELSRQSDDRVVGLAQDREGSLWIGTDSSGLHRLKEGSFAVIAAATGEPVHGLLQSRDGRMWLTSSSSVESFDGAHKPERLPVPTPLDAAEVVFQDHEGRLWVGAHSLTTYKDGRWQTIAIPDLGSAIVGEILEDDEGTIWLATRGKGIYTVKGGKIGHIGVGQGLPSPMVWELAFDRDRTLWAATGAGLSKIVGDRVAATYTAKDGLTSEYLYALYASADGAIWMGTAGGGLNRFKDGHLSAVTSRQGLASDTVMGMVEDGLGYLWMTSNTGISRVSLGELTAVADGRNERLTASLFGTADGLVSRECNCGTPIRSKDGRLWFPTMAGAAVVDPARLRRNPLPPPTVIEAVIVDGDRVDRHDGLRLRAGTERCEFRYAGLSLLAPERVRFQYKLEGYDSHWIDAGSQRVAHYTRLPPGEYVFRVKAANNDGVWNEEGASLAVRQLPFVYQTLWFRLTMIGAALAAAGLWVRGRLRRLHTRAARLEKLVGERTAELQAEKARSDRLLRNVLPAPVAERLKRGQHTIADQFSAVTVLFCDIVGFTSMSTRMSPREVVELLNGVFTAFDEAAASRGLEKIKTIGDAYMVAGGVPTPRSDHARAIAELALHMRESLARFNAESGVELSVRIGIHTGPVVAGVIGISKFAYDLWGDTVNTASRMESHGQPGEIQVSEATREALGDAYEFDERGVIVVKGKGEMRTFFLRRRRPAA